MEDRTMTAQQAGKCLKQYSYGKYGEVRVEVYENGIAVYRDPTGTRDWFSYSERQKAFGLARMHAERYRIIGRKFGD